MSESYKLRQQLIEIARLDKNKVEQSKNHAPWIEKFWPATNYAEGYKDRAPYCAAALAYCVRVWLSDIHVRAALGLQSSEEAEHWRCKSAAAFGWLDWAKQHNVQLLPKHCILHAGDLVVYDFSHIEMVTDDDNTSDGPFTAIGFNTNSNAARDSDGCVEKPRKRDHVKAFIRLLP